jgi:hypothetical protein
MLAIPEQGRPRRRDDSSRTFLSILVERYDLHSVTWLLLLLMGSTPEGAGSEGVGLHIPDAFLTTKTKAFSNGPEQDNDCTCF